MYGQSLWVREAIKKVQNLGHLPNRGGGSDRIGRLTQPNDLVIRNVKTTSDFLKVTPLISASEGQNNESKSYKGPNFLGGGGGGGSNEVWQMTQV